jgi:hypothetical protein
VKTWLNNLIVQWHEKGIMIPLIRNHGVGSVSLTLLWLSSVVLIMACFKIGKLEFWETLAWYATSAVLYYNKKAKFSKDGFEIGEEQK